MSRIEKVCDETLSEPTKEEVKVWAFHNMLRRMSDQEYDKYCLYEFGDKTPGEVEAIIKKKIRQGIGP